MEGVGIKRVGGIKLIKLVYMCTILFLVKVCKVFSFEAFVFRNYTMNPTDRKDRRFLFQLTEDSGEVFTISFVDFLHDVMNIQVI